MQTSYSRDLTPGLVGMEADTRMVSDIVSKNNPTEAVYVGCVVTKGTGDDDIVAPDAAADITDEKLVQGVVLRAHIPGPSGVDGDPQYPAKEAVPVMRKGRIWVKPEAAVTAGTSTVNVRFAAGAGGTRLGALRGAAVADETAVLPKSRWHTSTSAANPLAVLELDL